MDLSTEAIAFTTAMMQLPCRRLGWIPRQDMSFLETYDGPEDILDLVKTLSVCANEVPVCLRRADSRS